MTLTKVTAAICGAFLVLLLGKWAGDALYSTGGHSEEAAYVIEMETDDGAAVEEVEQVSFEELLASADIGKGAKVFKKCAACHKLEEGVNATGPSLYGVVGRPVASIDGFGYSGAMSEKGGDWTNDALDVFLTNPKGDVAGTAMAFSGLKKQSDRVNLIAYLDSIDG